MQQCIGPLRPRVTAPDLDHLPAAQFKGDERRAVCGNSQISAFGPAFPLLQVVGSPLNIRHFTPEVILEFNDRRTEQRVGTAAHFRHADLVIEVETGGAECVSPIFPPACCGHFHVQVGPPGRRRAQAGDVGARTGPSRNDAQPQRSRASACIAVLGGYPSLDARAVRLSAGPVRGHARECDGEPGRST